MILDALKASFEAVNSIKEQCEILDNFHSMSDRARVKDTYYQRADLVSKQLYNELSRLIHEAKLRLNYTKMYYPSLLVNFIRANALIQRGNAVIDDVTTSNVFLGDVQKLKAINRWAQSLYFLNLHLKVNCWLLSHENLSFRFLKAFSLLDFFLLWNHDFPFYLFSHLIEPNRLVPCLFLWLSYPELKQKKFLTRFVSGRVNRSLTVWIRVKD